MLGNIFNRDLVAVAPGASLLEVAKLMAKKDVGCVLVVENHKPCGLVTDRDIILHCVALGHNSGTCKVDEVMSTGLKWVKETDGIFDCVRAMRAAKVRRLPVVDEKGHAIGVVSFGDILAVLGTELFDLIEKTTPALEVTRKAA
jgi:CBS domain-containing protein